jgi:hypothetical protein
VDAAALEDRFWACQGDAVEGLSALRSTTATVSTEAATLESTVTGLAADLQSVLAATAPTVSVIQLQNTLTQQLLDHQAVEVRGRSLQSRLAAAESTLANVDGRCFGPE